MSYLKGKILLIFVLILAILALGAYVYFSNLPSPAQPTPIQIFNRPSSTPFTQIPFENLTQEQKKAYQDQADENYQKTEDEILRKYPWYLKLPLKDANYFVYFDPTTETFTAKLYPQRSSATSIDDQVNAMETNVIQRINELGSNSTSYKIDWKIIPE